MNQRPFRFGVVAAQAASGDAWIALARRAEELGYSTLLVPDRFGRLLAPLPALAVAVGATRSLRIGPFVLANGLRNPALLAWECATLSFLSAGRFELGLGTGVSEEDFREAGVDFGRPGARIDRLAETLRVVKAFFDRRAGNAGGSTPSGPSRGGFSLAAAPRPPILIAGAGPRLLALAAREADIVALGVGGRASEAELAEKIALVRQEAGERFASLELSLNLLAVISGPVAPGVQERIRALYHAELDALVQAGSPLIVAGSPEAMAEQLLERRERLGVSYVTISADQMDALAPVVRTLAGH